MNIECESLAGRKVGESHECDRGVTLAPLTDATCTTRLWYVATRPVLLIEGLIIHCSVMLPPLFCRAPSCPLPNPNHRTHVTTMTTSTTVQLQVPPQLEILRSSCPIIPPRGRVAVFSLCSETSLRPLGNRRPVITVLYLGTAQ